MKGKANEWVSIADLMAGVMAVVMLLLVVAVLQQTLGADGEQKQRNKAHVLLIRLAKTINSEGEEKFVSVDPGSDLVRLTFLFFRDGSACVEKDQATKAIQLIQPSITQFLADNPQGDVLVEGHTNHVPVSDIRGRTESQWLFDRTHCSLYDDNLTLSAARAREVRKQMLADARLNSSDEGRIIVAGYGDSHPIVGTDPNDDSNKRVEIRLRIYAKSEN